ncbi:MAG: NAD(P)/FAD-dependent oxidoreductase [Congregibacter sp.]
MDRRTLLKLLAAASVASVGQTASANQPLRVVVAGAGIVGASIAYHLAKAGAMVTVIDKERPASHASRGTFAWINATWAKTPRSYHTLNQQSVANWKDLHKSLGLPVRWGGSLEWFDNEARQDKLAEQIAEQFAWGERARMVGAPELAVLEPNVDFGGATRAAFSENDGTVDPVLATQLLLKAAKALGATVQYPCELTGVTLAKGRVTAVETSRGTIDTDKLVLATGAASDAALRFAGTDLPQRSTPGVIATMKPMRPCINRIIAAPGIHMHQRDDGRLVIGEQEGAPENEAHAQRLKGRPNDYPDRIIAEQHAARMLAVANRFAPSTSGAEVESVHIGWRPLPVDGHPVLGASPTRPDVYLAVMHSGVTLAPVVGQLVARELTEDLAIDQLQEFRPGRDFELVKRY